MGYFKSIILKYHFEQRVQIHELFWDRECAPRLASPDWSADPRGPGSTSDQSHLGPAAAAAVPVDRRNLASL